MTRTLLLWLSVPAATAALAGCATPQYPVTPGYVPPPPIAPQYSNRQAPAPDKPQAPQAEPAPSASQDAAAQADSPPPTTTTAPAAVESAPLAPAAAPPAAPSASPPAPSASPPVVKYKPPPPRPQPESYSPPQAVAAPRYRPPEVRYVTDGKVVAARGMYRDYMVQPGDHLDAIARDLQTTRRELVEANHLREPFAMRPGKHLKVPVAKAYVTVSGDTLPAVAKRFGVGLGELSNLNDLPERGRLTPGMFIALPANFDDHGPTRITEREEAYVAPRPHATYRTSAPPQYTPPSGPYVPSPEAIAAAAARRAASSQSLSSPYRSPYESARPTEAPVSQAAMVSSGQGRFIWPVRGDILSNFGVKGVGQRNDGVDISAPDGSEVRAAATGQVVYAGDKVPGFGNLVLIKHAAGWVSAYAHLGSVSVHMQQTVYQGDPVGTVGTSGGVSQPQLHFEIRYAPTPNEKANPLDPLLVLPK